MIVITDGCWFERDFLPFRLKCLPLQFKYNMPCSVSNVVTFLAGIMDAMDVKAGLEALIQAAQFLEENGGMELTNNKYFQLHITDFPLVIIYKPVIVYYLNINIPRRKILDVKILLRAK